MKKTYIAIAMMAAAFAANIETANAQTVNNQTERQALIHRLAKKGEAYLLSEGKPEKVSTPTALASQKTYIFDSEKLEMKAPVDYQGKIDTLMVNWDIAKRRSVLSGFSASLFGGYGMIAENGSPLVGGALNMAWKRIALTVGGMAAISKYNSESNLSGKNFVCPIAFAELLYIFRFPMSGYDNQGYIGFGPGIGYVFDKNRNDIGENSYETTTEFVTEKNEFLVEGNSTMLYLSAQGRFSLKHLGGVGMTVKVFGGVMNRYYLDGSRRKAIVGATIGIDLSFSKKNVDSDVKSLKTNLENGDYEFANQIINQMRAEKMK